LVADREQVLDVPPKLSARARVFATGQGRKTDATDAHSVALVGTRMGGLRPVVPDEQLDVLRLLVDRRRSLGEEHTRKIAQLPALLLELIPGGAIPGFTDTLSMTALSATCPGGRSARHLRSVRRFCLPTGGRATRSVVTSLWRVAFTVGPWRSVGATPDR
jgi:transposase